MSYGDPCCSDSVSNYRQTEHLQLPEFARIPGHMPYSAAHQAGHHPSERRYHMASDFRFPVLTLSHETDDPYRKGVCVCVCVHVAVCLQNQL